MKIIVEGDFACFTNPLYRGINKITYDIPTITAITGLLKSIYWKPAIEYEIKKIVVYNPIQTITMGVKFLTTIPTLKTGKQKVSNLDNIRTIATITALQNVKYGIEFDIRVLDEFKKIDPIKHCKDNYVQQINKRLYTGNYFVQPYLGLSRFSCKSIIKVDTLECKTIHPSLKGKKQFDNVLYKMEFNDDYNYNKWKESKFSNEVKKAFYYDPVMNYGVIDVEKYKGDIYESYQVIM